MLFRLKNFSVLMALLAFSVTSCKDDEEKKVEPTDPCANTSIVVAPSVIGNAVTISASNGAEPYTYSLDGVSFISNPDFSDLAPGDYTVSVKDTNGCTATVEISIQEPDPTTLVDSRDGQTYELVTIGEQTWMAENLNYDNGHDSYCYEDKEDTCKKYGKLYSFASAQTACPSGYHLPSDEEWQTLERALGMSEEEVEKTTNRTASYGALLKEGSSSGFEAKLSGVRGGSTNYYDIGGVGAFWTSTIPETVPDRAIYRSVSNNNNIIIRSARTKDNAISVRCIAD